MFNFYLPSISKKRFIAKLIPFVVGSSKLMYKSNESFCKAPISQFTVNASPALTVNCFVLCIDPAGLPLEVEKLIVNVKSSLP